MPFENESTSSNQRWSRQRKVKAVLRLLGGLPLEDLARELGVERKELAEWRDRALCGIDEALRPRAGDPLQAELDAAMKCLADLTMDVEVLQRRCERADLPPLSPEEVEVLSKETSPTSGRRYGVDRLCRLGNLARSTYFHWRRSRRTGEPDRKRRKPGPKTDETDTELQVMIEQVLDEAAALRLGYRRVSEQLARRGVQVSGKRVLRVIRERLRTG